MAENSKNPISSVVKTVDQIDRAIKLSAQRIVEKGSFEGKKSLMDLMHSREEMERDLKTAALGVALCVGKIEKNDTLDAMETAISKAQETVEEIKAHASNIQSASERLLRDVQMQIRPMHREALFRLFVSPTGAVLSERRFTETQLAKNVNGPLLSGLRKRNLIEVLTSSHSGTKEIVVRLTDRGRDAIKGSFGRLMRVLWRIWVFTSGKTLAFLLGVMSAIAVSIIADPITEILRNRLF